VAQIQQLLGMENPQSIYIWENPEKKYLPRLDNLITLAKLYKVTLDEIIIIKEEETTDLFLSEKTPAYGITKETLDFIKDHSNLVTKSALKNYYGITI
jgi:transcriptional regulator with XRE-family HTH domain